MRNAEEEGAELMCADLHRPRKVDILVVVRIYILQWRGLIACTKRNRALFRQ